MRATVLVGMGLVLLAGCSGEAGPPGPAGPSGAAGAEGPAGKDATGAVADGAKIVRSISCNGNLDGTPLQAFYSVAIEANGTVFASGSVRDASIGASETAVFAPNQNGAATAQVLVSLDALGPANNGYFSIALNRETLVATVVYKDADASGGEDSWTMQPTACVSNTY
jgi:hypothetical protein